MMIASNHRLRAKITLAAWALAFAAGITATESLADSVYIRNPLDTPAQITSEWNHPSTASPPYSERSLDTVYDESRTTSGGDVISRVDNVNTNIGIYYDSFDYGSTSCSGVKHVMYENPNGTGQYNYIGTVVYLHMSGHQTGWYSKTISAGASEYRTIGYIHSGDCGTPPHLHHGRVTDSGSMTDASWLTSSIGSGNDYDVTSNDITLYK